jgi:mannose-6-phosphate isomerase-like protein (cupin superfamily)
MSNSIDPTIAKNWRERGFSCDLWIDPPGQMWEGYVHTVDEVVMVLEGHMEFEVDGLVHHPAVGEELVIPANVIHSVRNLGVRTAQWLYGYRNESRE